MKVSIDRNECIGCENCALSCPDVFDIDDAERAYVVRQPEGEKEESYCEVAASICPANCIAIED